MYFVPSPVALLCQIPDSDIPDFSNVSKANAGVCAVVVN